MPTNPRPNPYVGPRAFEVNERLYGRETETRRLANLLLAERIVLLYSPSGAGKTSLIQAALIPELQGKKTSKTNFYLRPVIRINREPRQPLVNAAFNRYLYSFLSSLESARPEAEQIPDAELAALSLAGYLERRPKPEGINFEVFIFDQFEEILTLNPTDLGAKQEFFTSLGELLNDRTRWALFSMREDFIAALEPYTLSIPTHLSNTFRLDLLSADAARQAIQKPVRPEVEFNNDAAELLVEDLRSVQVQRPDGKIVKQPGPYVEPVQLQVVCYRLWENLAPDDVQIDKEDVTAAGDVDIALASYYAERVKTAALETGVHERTIREWFDRKLISKQGIRGQVLKGSDEIEGLPKVIDLLDRAHLVRSERRGGAYWIELSHDRLVHPIQKNNAEWFQANLSLLQQQAALWHEQGQKDALLLRDQALAEAEAWTLTHEDELNDVEKLCLKNSRDIQKRELEARESKEQKIKLAEKIKSETKLRRLSIGLAVVLLIAIVMAAIAVSLGSEARASEKIAQEQAATATNAQGIAQQQATAAMTLRMIAQEQAAIATNALGLSNQRGTQVADQAGTAEAQRVRAETERANAITARALAETASTQAAAEATKSAISEAEAIVERNKAITESTAAAAARLEADKQRRAALFNGLINNAMSNVDYQPDLALLLSVEAEVISDTVQARSALLTSLQHTLSGNLLPFAKNIPQQDSPIYQMKFSPKGNYLAWGGFDGLLVLWDIKNEKVAWRKNAHGYQKVYTVAFSPDEQTLASGGEDGSIILWDVASGIEKTHFTTNHDYVLDLDYSPDGTMLASSGLGPWINLWEVQTLSPTSTPIRTLAPMNGGNDVWSVAWSHQGKYLASAGSDKTVRIWNPTTGTELLTLRGHEGTVYSVAWSPDDTQLASGGKNDPGKMAGSVYVWDVATGRPTPIQDFTSPVYSLDFSPDGNLLATSSLKTLTLWNASTLKLVDQVSDHNNEVFTMAFSTPEQNLIATGGFDQKIFLYELATQAPLYKILENVGGVVQGLYYGANGSIFAAADSGPNHQTAAYAVQAGAKQILSIPDRFAQFSAFSPNGQLLAFGEANGYVQAVDIATGYLYPLIEKVEGSLTSLAFSPDNSTLAVGVCVEYVSDFCAQNAIALWNAMTGEMIGPSITQLPSKQTGKILSLAFSPDGSILASGGEDQTIILWDIFSRETIGTPFIGSSDQVTSLAFSYPDGKMLASGSENGQLILWDYASRRPIGEPFQVASSAITSLAFSPDGLSLVSGSSTGQVTLWDLNVTAWIDRACKIANRALTPDEWNQYITGETYNPKCNP